MSAAAAAVVQCCQCGALIEPNPTCLCLACLRSRVDITEGIQRQCALACCPKCARFLQPPNHWVSAEPESKELLAMCLKRVKGLNRVRLVDAGFVWTEPHSRRVRVRVTVQAEVMNGAVAEQSAEVEFALQSQQCEQCNRGAAKDYWRAVVQLRQHAGHPKTLLFLEQLILKHQAQRECTGVRKTGRGLDFFFAQRQDARRLVDFLMAHSPSRCQASETLVSHDTHSNVYNYKHTFCVEVAPVCKGDVVCLPAKLAAKLLGGVGQFCIVYRVTDRLHLIEPASCRTADVTGKQYWQAPFQAISAGLSSFTVTNCEPVAPGESRERHAAADVWLLTDSDLSAEEVHTRTHLGRVLRCGDTALGVDLRAANVNHAELERLEEAKVPDVLLVKKIYQQDRRRLRRWRLRRLQADEANDEESRAYQEFLEDLEEDKELRKGVNIYKDSGVGRQRQSQADAEAEACEAPQISVEEMLEDLALDDAPME